VGARVLTMQGYQVLEAGNAQEARRALHEHPAEIHLLFTDVVLPGIGGRELAEQVRQMRPGIKIIFASGYTDDMILQHQLLDRNVTLVQKPFTRETLARKVREVLDR